uniref:Transmembrane protein n=1 Tax=Nelumbo nucifera TaxID=4432 RepID=A0A822XHD8_NELNU|nr:TPA_asm: hypothetical protein HUJ06_021263 [Nelumbo nucifera]
MGCHSSRKIVSRANSITLLIILVCFFIVVAAARPLDGEPSWSNGVIMLQLQSLRGTVPPSAPSCHTNNPGCRR